MKREGHLAHIGNGRNGYKILVKVQRKVFLKHLGVNGETIIKRISEEQDVSRRTGFNYLKVE
jgi:hypothetical protein